VLLIRQVNHHAAIGGSAARDVMTAATHGNLKRVVARKLQGLENVGRAEAASNECGPLVDQAVVHPSRFVIAQVGGPQDASGE
jgi:hypothetical protein